MELTPFDASCRELLDAAPRVHSRACFRNAFNHLELAEKIKALDPLMAAFRMLTAEEEAASGLMYCLKERNYGNAQLLKPKDHAYKNAMMPFITILGIFFGELLDGKGVEPTLHLRELDGETRLTLMLPMKVGVGEKWAYPLPPLNFGVTSDSKRLSYKRQVEAYLKSNGKTDVLSCVREQANVRNCLLYAGTDGFPHAVEFPDDFFAERLRRVLVLLGAYLFIQPYMERQPFVQNALDAYLALLGSLREHDLHGQL